LFQLTL